MGIDEGNIQVMDIVSHMTFSVLVANPKKLTLHGGQSRSYDCTVTIFRVSHMSTTYYQ